MSATPASAPRRQNAPTARRRAWLWFASTPLFLVAAFATGEGLAALLGLPEGDVPTADWRELLVLVVALAVLAIPAVGALTAARHSRGDLLARLPGWILVALVLVFLATNVVGLLVPPAPD